MRLNPKYIMREVAGETLLISLEDISAPKRLLCLNELGVNIYSLLRAGKDEEQIVTDLLAEYEVEESCLRADVCEFLQRLLQFGVLME